MWYLVIKESKTATCQLGVQQPNQALSMSQTKCQSHSKTSCDICMFRCKTCPFRARTQNSCKKLSRNQNYFSSCQRQKSPAQSGATASIHLQSPLLSTHHCLRVPATYLCPQIINGGFWGVRINQNLCKEKPYLYLIRSSQAQQVWAKNVIMIQNKPEIYLWPTLKKIQKRTKPKPKQIKLFVS